MRKYVVVGYIVDYPQEENNKDLEHLYEKSPTALALDVQGEKPEIVAVFDVKEKADADAAGTTE